MPMHALKIKTHAHACASVEEKYGPSGLIFIRNSYCVVVANGTDFVTSVPRGSWTLKYFGFCQTLY